MIFSPDNWKNEFRHEGLLYFNQRITEMLSNDTNHIYKAPVLNTALLVDEFLQTAKNVNEGIIEKNHLVSIMEEFRSSFKEDPVVEKHIERSLRNRIINRTMEQFKDDWKATMEYAKNLLCDYNKWCKSFLFENITAGGEIKIIEQGIRCFIPGMVAFGYSKDFIYHFNIQLFNLNTVSSISVLRTFLNRFDFKERKYNVYIAVDSGIKPFRKVLKEVFHVSFGPFKNNKSFIFDKHKYILSRIQVTALDEYIALKNAFSILNEFFSYYCFFAEQTENWYFRNAIVVNSKGISYDIPLKAIRQHRPLIPRTECSILSSVFTIMKLKKKSRHSYQRINMALKMHNTAVNDSDIKNCFLDFWSVLEILFVSERRKTKLEEIKDKIIPVLIKDYFRYLFSFVNITASDLEDQIKTTPVEDLFSEKDKRMWLYLIPFSEYSPQREKLYDVLKDYP